jgi:hypothetical protein
MYGWQRKSKKQRINASQEEIRLDKEKYMVVRLFKKNLLKLFKKRFHF